VYAADDVDFALKPGQSIGIAGESACGKSTLGLSVIRMLQGGTVRGEVSIDGQSILDMDESKFDSEFRWKKISMVFQGAMNSLDPVFTVQKQFEEILRQHNFSGDSRQVIKDAVESVSLDSVVLKKYPHELSGGMKQRVIIAMALLLKPKLVIADEPTTALDVLIQAQIVNLLKKLKKDGMSFMLITHDLAVLSEISDVVGIMYGGEIVEFGASEEIYKNPKHPYTQGLLESIPTLKGNAPKYIKGTPPSLLEEPTQCRFIDRCPQAIEKCKKLPPRFKTKTGYVRCWLYE
jgi:peptide/nickel transport system ATP-binding protein